MNVRVVKQREKVVLVEYTNNNSIERVWIPRDELKDNDVRKEVLRRGVKYGLPWSELLSDSAFDGANLLAEIESLLRRHEVWTLSDLMNKSQVMRGTIQRIVESLLSSVIDRAKEYCSVIREE